MEPENHELLSGCNTNQSLDDDHEENNVSNDGEKRDTTDNTEPAALTSDVDMSDNSQTLRTDEDNRNDIVDDNREFEGLDENLQEKDDDSSPKKQKHLHIDEMKFMENFDPNQRLIKKKLKKFTEFGVLEEKCDCLIPLCVGCHYPCTSCGSRLCGHECRKNRVWNYEEIEVCGRAVCRTGPEHS